MQPRIVAYLNGKQVLCIPIAESATGIGRDADNAVQLSAPEVSKHHAVVQHTPEGWRIWDRDSRNGVFVNGSKLKTAILKNGDEIGIGPYLLVLEVEDDGYTHVAKIRIDLSDNAMKQTITARQ